MDEARDWNYLFFINGGEFTGKYYFYFINQIEYVNDNTVELFLEMDVMQTYHFDYEMLKCFVEREHAATDAIGANVLDEGLEVGEYISLSDKDVDLNDYQIMVLATMNPLVAANELSEVSYAYGRKYDNVFSGLGVYCVDLSNASRLQVLLTEMDSSGTTDTVVGMWMYPGELVDKATELEGVAEAEGSKSFSVSITRNSVLESNYVPRNNKLYCYPYNFLYVSNNQGGAAVYPYEYFGDSDNPHFKVCGSISPDGCVRMYPLNYKGSQHNFESGLTLSNFPTCSWDSDVYKLWLAQNQNSLQLAGTTAVIKAAAGAAVGAVGLASGAWGVAAAGATAAVSGAKSIAELMAQRSDKAVQPEEARGNYSATVNMSAGFQTFTIRKKCITLQQALRIDDYFDMYGYKTCLVKKPNRHCRTRWTYTKTVGCKIAGDMCTADQVKIESIYDKGVTFWVDGDSIGNYLPDNACTGVFE